MNETLERINQLNTEIKALQDQNVQLQASANDWLNQSKVACTQTLKSKREACQADKAYKLSMYNTRMAQIKANQDSIALKKSEIDALNEAQKASNVATVNLSTQGLSNEALVVQAEGQADAVKKAAEIEAQAKASATTTEAQSAATMKNVIIGVIVLAVILALVFFIRKMKSSTKKSK